MKTETVKPNEENSVLADVTKRPEHELHVFAYPKNVAVGYDRDRFEWVVEVHDPAAKLAKVRTVWQQLDTNGHEVSTVTRAVRDSLLFAGGVGTKVCSYELGTTPEAAGIVEKVSS